MVGKSQISISGPQFSAGLATSDYLGDGGIGTSSYNLSLIAQPGVVYATAQNSSIVSLSNNPFLASCEDPRTSPSGTLANRILVNTAGNFSYSTTSSITSKKTASSSSGFQEGSTDMVAYGGDIYCSIDIDVMKLTVPATITNSWTLDETWWSTTMSQGSLPGTGTAHSMLVYEGSLWISGGNTLSKYDGTTATPSVLTLASGEQISALSIDPSTGLMMIAAHTVRETDDKVSKLSYIYLYDGYSSKPRRKIPVEGMITAFRNVGGQVFVISSNMVGAYNQYGVTFLRKLGAGFSQTSIPYKQRTASFRNQLLVVDGKDVLAYGDVLNGKKIWHPIYRNQDTGENIYSIAVNGNGSTSSDPTFIVNFKDSTNSQYPFRFVTPYATTTTPVTDVGVLQTNNINFERPVNIHRVRVFTTGITTTTGIGAVSIIDENGTTVSPTTNKFVVASGTKYVFDFDFGSYKLQTLQPSITMDTQAFGIVRVVIYYDVAE